MNSDFRVATDWSDHPKTLHLIRTVGEHGALCLIRLWSYTAEHRPDGRLLGLDDRSVECRAGWTGEPGAFIRAILEPPPGRAFKHGFAQRDKTGMLSLHDWKEHNAYASAAPVRHLAAKIASAARWNKPNRLMRAASNPLNADGHHAPSPAPVPAPSPVPDPTTEDKLLPVAKRQRRVRPVLPPVSTEQTEREKWQVEAFTKLWTRYPKKEAKQVSFDAFVRINPDKDLVNRIALYVRRKIEAGDWQATPERRKFIPALAVVINQRRWEDEQ